MNRQIQPLLHSVAQAAQRLQVSESSVWRLLKLGQLRPTLVLGRTMISESELLRFIAEATKAPRELHEFAVADPISSDRRTKTAVRSEPKIRENSKSLKKDTS